MNYIICLGLMLVPFIFTNDSLRLPKIILVLVTSLALGIFLMYKKNILRNKWLLAMLAMIPINIFFSEKVLMEGSTLAVSYMWIYNTLAYCMCYFILYISLINTKITGEWWDRILKIAVGIGVALSLYSICSFFGFDQWFQVSLGQEAAHVPSNYLGASLAHPTFLGAFLVMILPLCLYYKYWLRALLLIGVICLTQSQVAIGAMCLSVMFCIVAKHKKVFFIWIVLLMITAGASIFAWNTNAYFRQFANGSGRFREWKAISEQIKTDKNHCMTGHGMGSFGYSYRLKQKSSFREAHNEYLELIYDYGLIGCFLFIMFLLSVFKNHLFSTFRYKRYVLASLFGICVCAGANLVWHLGAHIYYTILLLGLLEGGIDET